MLRINNKQLLILLCSTICLVILVLSNIKLDAKNVAIGYNDIESNSEVYSTHNDDISLMNSGVNVEINLNEQENKSMVFFIIALL